MVDAIAFPSPVMRIDPATNALIVARRDPDTGVVESQTPSDGALQRQREARTAEARGACRRETPVTCTMDGTLIEGIVDLAFEEHGSWTVVDYKTDRELAAAGEDRYRRQVALYALAIAEATGQPAVGVLIRV